MQASRHGVQNADPGISSFAKRGVQSTAGSRGQSVGRTVHASTISGIDPSTIGSRAFLPLTARQTSARETSVDRLRVGLLGMPDNCSTPVIVAELDRLDRALDVVFLLHADFKEQIRRFVRKLKTDGLRAALQRVLFAFASRWLTDSGRSLFYPTGCTVHHIRDPNDKRARQLIASENLDLLLVATDSRLARNTFMIPRLGTLCAHPGWLPTYRGLGCIRRMLRDGEKPAITVHIVDDGVNTGPIVLRERANPAIAHTGISGDLVCYREQARLFAKAIRLLEGREVPPTDSFGASETISCPAVSNAPVEPIRRERRRIPKLMRSRPTVWSKIPYKPALPSLRFTTRSWQPHSVPPRTDTSFTHSGYRQMLIALAGAGYSFFSFAEATSALSKRAPFVLLRHDIDMDLQPALSLATVEAELGIRATYFFLIRTELYNPFSLVSVKAIKSILSLGHHLGLHFDCGSYPHHASVSELASACRREAAMLEDWFGSPVSAVSYHRPSPLVLTGDPALSAPRPHTYQKLFIQQITYLSDSRGRWSHGEPLQSEAYQQRRPLHILVHPIWWNEKTLAPLRSLERYVDRRQDLTKRELARNCTVYKLDAPQGE